MNLLFDLHHERQNYRPRMACTEYFPLPSVVKLPLSLFKTLSSSFFFNTCTTTANYFCTGKRGVSMQCDLEDTVTSSKVVLFFKLFFMFIHLWETEKDTAWVGKGQRERETQALSYQHKARQRARTHRQRDHDLSPSRTLNSLSHPRAPPNVVQNPQQSWQGCHNYNLMQFTY